MKRSKKNIERNKLDYLLTDIMPVEVSELFSYSKFYEYLLSKQSTLDDIVSKMLKIQKHRLLEGNGEIGQHRL